MNKTDVINKIKSLPIINKAENAWEGTKYKPFTLELVELKKVLKILNGKETNIKSLPIINNAENAWVDKKYQPFTLELVELKKVLKIQYGEETNVKSVSQYTKDMENVTKIVIDTEKHIFESPEKIAERLNYFRQISASGLEHLSNSELDKIKSDFNSFLNINLTLFADIYPTKLFRITRNKRLYKGNQYKLQRITDLLGPPEEFANMGRVNLKGESVFYCALDFNTAVWETQPEEGEYITLSEWRIKDGQKIYNHFIFHPEETNLSKESQDAFNGHLQQIGVVQEDLKKSFIEILKFIAEEFMKSVEREKSANYLFSSIIGSRFLQSGKDSNGFKIEAISYPSTRRDCAVTNIAILNSLVLEKLELVSAKIMTVGETNYDLENKNRDDLIKISALVTESERFDFENNKIYWNLKKELDDAIRLHQESENNKQ